MMVRRMNQRLDQKARIGSIALFAPTLLLATIISAFAQTVPLGPRFVLPYQTVIDATGVPIPGAQLFFYQSGTNTPLNTYSDPLLTTPNSNPVPANGAGVFPNIFLNGNYKVVLTDSAIPPNQIWTADPVDSVAFGAGVDTNTPNIQTTNYQIAPSDCTKTVLMGTGSTGQLTLTLPAVTGFPANCSILIKNGDGASGKILSGFPTDLNSILYPKQSVGVKIVNGAWASFYNPGPWSPITPGSYALYASPTGIDTNDCLTSATVCTLKHACLVRQTVYNSGAVNINLAAGTYSSVDSNNALCSILGNNGGTSPTLTSLIGAGGTFPTSVIFAVPANDAGVYIKDGGEVSISGIEFTGGNGSIGIENSGQSAVTDYTNVTWGAWGTGGVHVSLAEGSYVNLGAGGENIVANFASSFHWIVGANGVLTAGGATAIANSTSWAGGAFLTGGTGNPYINLAGWSFTGTSLVGPQANLVGNGYLVTPSSAKCAAALPGSANTCAISNGFQTSGNDFPTTPNAGASTFPVVAAGINFNSATTDTAVTIPPLPPGAWGYAINSIRLGNASHSLSTATVGVFTSTGGSGTIAADQAITVTTGTLGSANNTMSLTLTNGSTQAYSATTLYVRVGTPESAAATGDVTIQLVYIY